MESINGILQFYNGKNLKHTKDMPSYSNITGKELVINSSVFKETKLSQVNTLSSYNLYGCKIIEYSDTYFSYWFTCTHHLKVQYSAYCSVILNKILEKFNLLKLKVFFKIVEYFKTCWVQSVLFIYWQISTTPKAHVIGLISMCTVRKHYVFNLGQ